MKNAWTPLLNEQPDASSEPKKADEDRENCCEGHREGTRWHQVAHLPRVYHRYVNRYAYVATARASLVIANGPRALRVRRDSTHLWRKHV